MRSVVEIHDAYDDFLHCNKAKEREYAEVSVPSYATRMRTLNTFRTSERLASPSKWHSWPYGEFTNDLSFLGSSHRAHGSVQGLHRKRRPEADGVPF